MGGLINLILPQLHCTVCVSPYLVFNEDSGNTGGGGGGGGDDGGEGGGGGGNNNSEALGQVPNSTPISNQLYLPLPNNILPASGSRECSGHHCLFHCYDLRHRPAVQGARATNYFCHTATYRNHVVFANLIALKILIIF